MEILVEISKYPLSKEYDKPILHFIERLKKYDQLNVDVSDTSTRIRGEYELVMYALRVEMKQSFEEGGRSVFVVKVLNFD